MPTGSDFTKWKNRKDKNQAQTQADTSTSQEKPPALPDEVSGGAAGGAGSPVAGAGSPDLKSDVAASAAVSSALSGTSLLETSSSSPTSAGTLSNSGHNSPLSGGAGGPVRAAGKMNATFVTLARNSDLWDIIDSIRGIEDRFNRNYGYDWVFLNDKPFDEEFKKTTSALISGKTHYGTIPTEHWSFPEWIDQSKAQKVREDMAERKIIYGDSVSYRHMCRFESGFFFQQPLLQNYEWYWRVEPSVKIFCDIKFDPFKYMADNKKKYSFVLSLYEYVETIPTIWDSTKKFMTQHPEHIAPDNSLSWLSEDDGETYNHCHFVSLSCCTSFSMLPGEISDWLTCNSGPTSRLATSTGSDRQPTLTSSTRSTGMEVSSTSDGGMHLCIRSPLVFYSTEMKSTSSRTLDTGTYHSHTAQRTRRRDWNINAIVIRKIISIGRATHVSRFLSFPNLNSKRTLLS